MARRTLEERRKNRKPRKTKRPAVVDADADLRMFSKSQLNLYDMWVPDVKSQSYKRRNKTLRKMGFSSYLQYLGSPLWKSVRKMVWLLRGFRCALCGGKANQLHHNSYEKSDLCGDTLSHIHPLCRKCHLSVEFTPTGEKRSFHDAVVAFTKIADARHERQIKEYHDWLMERTRDIDMYGWGNEETNEPAIEFRDIIRK